MNKGLKIVLIILGVIVLIIGGGFLYLYSTVYKSETVVAQLSIKTGSVQVDTGNGYMNAVDGMDLALTDKVKTSSNGEASIILYESVIISLDPNTEVSVTEISKDNVKIKQDSGSTWNKFTDLAGVKSLEVETPTTVATVRGTEFGIDYIDEVATVLVAEGRVLVESEGESITVGEFEKIVKRIGKKLEKADLVKADMARIRKKVKNTIDELKRVRVLEIEKNRDIIEKTKSKYGVSEDELWDSLDQIDRGELDDKELMEKSPVQTESMQKVKALNDVIKVQTRLADRVEESS